jgi:DNA ligase-1
MIRCQGNEAKYIVRSLQGKLRIGTAAQTVLVSLAHAVMLSPTTLVKEAMSSSSSSKNNREDNDEETNEKSEKTEMEMETENLLELVQKIKEKEPREASKLRTDKHLNVQDKKELAEIAVKRAFSECPNLSILVSALISKPLYQLYQSCRLIPGVPVAPMLAKPTKAIGEVLKRLSGLAFTMEYKYDGERAQVHLLDDGSVKIFSRNSEDNTEKYPDLMDVIRRAKNQNITSCVLDAEVVAYDREKGCLLPFQILSTRKRKVEGGEADADNQKVKVVLQAFDMLYINGKSLLSESFRTRRHLLRQSFTTDEGFFYFASGADHVEDGDTAPIEALMQEACTSMCEGLMVKTLDSNASYEPSKRLFIFILL